MSASLANKTKYDEKKQNLFYSDFNVILHEKSILWKYKIHEIVFPLSQTVGLVWVTRKNKTEEIVEKLRGIKHIAYNIAH